MPITHPRVRLLAGATGVALLAGGCGLTQSTAGPTVDPSSGKQAQVVNITISNTGCSVAPATFTAGAVQFSVKNDNAGKVTEAEFQDGGFTMGEQENLTPGLSGSFALTVDGGEGHEYTVYCPGATKDRTPVKVTGAAAQSWKSDPAQVAAVKSYTTYVQSKVALLVPATKAFAAAVTAGQVGRSKELFAKARYYYEQIEPVAESFGDLDPQIDGRIDDAATPADFLGFHRIEQSLWTHDSTKGMTPVAAGLVANVEKLQRLTATVALQPAQIANGATELMNEVETSKITGEEDRYSHTDLSDFEANLVGAQTAFAALKPLLVAKDPALAATIVSRDAAVSALLARYRADPGYEKSGYVDYATVTQGERQRLTAVVDPYVNALSKMSGVLA